MVFFQVFQADFKMKFSSTSHYVLTTLLNHTLHKEVDEQAENSITSIKLHALNFNTNLFIHSFIYSFIPEP